MTGDGIPSSLTTCWISSVEDDAAFPEVPSEVPRAAFQVTGAFPIFCQCRDSYGRPPNPYETLASPTALEVIPVTI